MKTTTQYLSRLMLTAVVIMGLSVNHASAQTTKTEQVKPEAKNQQAQAVNPQVQSEVENVTATKRAELLKEAQSALEQTHNAVQALDQGDKEKALSALAQVTGELDLIVARDPKLALAPVGVTTIIRDLYATPETVNDAIKTAKSYLADGKVQQARAILSGLASEADVQVSNLPLASYPSAIKDVAALIDAGKLNEAKTALNTALSTIVIQNYITPLPTVRATAMLDEAEKLTENKNRTAQENQKLHDLLVDAGQELKLGEALGYGDNVDYRTLYVQLDEIQTKTEGGKSGTGFFTTIRQYLDKFKTASHPE